MKLCMIDQGVSESLFSLEVEVGSGDSFVSIPDEVYCQMQANGKPLRRSMYTVACVRAKLCWRDTDFETYTVGNLNPNSCPRRTFASFELAYGQARLTHGKSLDATRVEDVIRYSEEMGANPDDSFPNPILRKRGDHLVQIDGARRLMARLLAGQNVTQVYVVMLREELKNILDQRFIDDIKTIYATNRWFKD